MRFLIARNFCSMINMGEIGGKKARLGDMQLA
jgi:hypothetical protein